MFSSANKTTKTAPAVQQKAAGTTFFRKAGEETFFGAKENPAFFNKPAQPKLKVSTPDDPQEKEADAVADKVMRMEEPVFASKEDKKEEKLQSKEDEEVKTKRLTSLSSNIQCKEDQEKLQAKADQVQRKEEGGANNKSESASIAGSEINRKNISLYHSDIMRESGRGPPTTSIPFEQTLASSKGGGSALRGNTQQFMESRFNADFSGVRVHTDSTAVSLTRNVNAQAFAHGNDIYFNSDKYSPDTTGGRTLLAHELTHTIQQGASRHTSHLENSNTSGNTNNPIYTKKGMHLPQDAGTPGKAKIFREKADHNKNRTQVLKKEWHAQKDPALDKDKSAGVASGNKSNSVKSTDGKATADTKKKGNGLEENKKKNTVGLSSKSQKNKTSPSNSKVTSANLKQKSKNSKKEVPKEQKGKVSGKKGKKDPRKLATAKSNQKPLIRKAPSPKADAFPSLAELFGPLPAKKKEETKQFNPQHARQQIMRQAQVGAFQLDASVADPPVIDFSSFTSQITAASAQQQQSVAAQAQITKAQLVGSAEGLKQSIISSINSTVASVRESFNAEKQSLNTAIDSTAAQMATALETRQADALQSGETTKSKLTESFTTNRTEIQLLITQKSQQVTDNKNEEIEHARNGTSQQATTARNSGQQKAGTYPGDERGRIQADAATGVANETASEIEKKQPEIIDAINEAMEGVPAAFQEQGQSYFDGLTDNLQQLNTAIDEQVKSTGGLLTEQSVKANGEIEKLRQESAANLDTLEQAAVEQIQLNIPQVESEVAETLNSSIQEIDSAQGEVIKQLQKLEKESITALRGAETIKVAQDFTTEVVLALDGIGNAAGSGFQQAGAGMSGSFAHVEESTVNSLNAAKLQVTQNLQAFQDKSSSGMSNFAHAVDKGLEQQVAAQVSAFMETETTVVTKLTEGKEALNTTYDAKVTEIRQQLNTTVTQGLAKNDEALAQLDSKMSKAAEDAGWDYDHPILSAIGSVLEFIAGAILALVVIFAIALLVFLAFELIVAGLVAIGLSSEVAAAIVIIAGVGLLIYGVYTDYQARVKRGEGGGWGTFGMALLDFTGLTGMYNAFAGKGLSPFERGLMFGEGLGKFVLTLLLVRGAWKGIRGGGLAEAWKNLRLPKVVTPETPPPVIAPPTVTPPKIVPPEVVPPEVTPPEVKPPEKVPPEVVPVRPEPPVTRPAARHSARGVKQGTVAKEVNTVIASDVPVAEDVAAINRGEATVGRSLGGETTYTVNGRTYGSHANGTLYPIEGNGFITLDRGGFKALGVYNEFGETPRAEEILDNMGISQAKRAMARSAHDSGQR